MARGVFGNDQEFCKQSGYECNPDKAMELLAEIGYGPDNPLETTVFVWTGGNRHKLAEIFRAQLAQVGIDASIEIMDIGTMNARVKEQNESPDDPSPGTFDMMTWSWYDPDILYQLWHGPGACSGFQNAELDAMLEQTRTTIEPEARLEKVQAVIQYPMENAVHIGLYSPGWERVFVVRPEVEGFKIGPFLHPVFTDVKIDGQRPPCAPAGPARSLPAPTGDDMTRVIAQRLLAALVTIWIATIAVTLLIHLVPGDPVRIMYGSFQTTPEQL